MYILFPTGLPKFLRHSSGLLVHRRNRRTFFICSVIVLMSGASAVGLFLCKASGTAVSNEYDSFFVEGKSALVNISLNGTIHHNITINLTNASINYPIDTHISDNFTTVLENGNITSHMLGKLLNLTAFEGSYRETELLRRGELEDFALNNNGKLYSCQHPEYIVFTWILCLIALATVLKLYYLVKTTMAAVMVACYISLIIKVYPYNFEKDIGSGMPLSFQMLILLVVFLIMVAYHARLVEVSMWDLI